MLTQDPASARAERQLAYIAHAKRNTVFAIATSVINNVLYAVSERMFYLGKYSSPLMLVVVELSLAAFAARQLPIQNARLSEQTTRRSSKRKSTRSAGFAVQDSTGSTVRVTDGLPPSQHA
jgi:hypothetical protein